LIGFATVVEHQQRMLAHPSLSIIDGGYYFVHYRLAVDIGYENSLIIIDELFFLNTDSEDMHTFCCEF